MTVLVVSLLLMGLMVLSIGTGDRAMRTSARDRNSELALAIAEGGVHEATARIEASGGTGFPTSFTGTTPQGTYEVTIVRTPGGFVIESIGHVGREQLGRSRKVRVTLGPPNTFKYAIFSNTSIELKNNDDVTGDVWANDSILLESNGTIRGSVTAARSWIQLQGGTTVEGDVWSGGYNPSGPWAINLSGASATVMGNAWASVSAPTDPTTCSGENQADFRVLMHTGAQIGGDLTTWGEYSGGSVQGTYTPYTCTAAAVPLSMPGLVVNRYNYDQSTYQEFSSVPDFQTWLASNKTDMHGTFVITDPSGSQSRRIDLTGVVVTGNTTLITNSPVFTNGITDDNLGEYVFVVASSYQPPAGSACDVNRDSSECAVHIKNDFQSSCKTATLIYANAGPVAVKNNSNFCGAIYADSILIKNNQVLTYDTRVSGVVGFGDVAFQRDRWEESAT